MKYSWSKIEPWTWIIGVTLPVVPSAIYMLVKEKTINPLELLRSKKLKIQEKKYSQFNFDISLLDKLKLEKNNLRDEIDELKSQYPTIAKK